MSTIHVYITNSSGVVAQLSPVAFSHIRLPSCADDWPELGVIASFEGSTTGKLQAPLL